MHANPFTAAHDLLRSHESNTALYANADDGPDEWATRAFHAALGGPVLSDLLATSPATPLLRWSETDVPAVSLLGAMVHPPTHRAKHCDRCSQRMMRGLPVYRLWMPGGQSAVEFQFCPHCHAVLNDVYRDGDARLLVWR